LVSSGGSGVWRSDDFGGTWTLAEMEPGYYFNTFRTPITISNADQRVVWVGAANNYVQLSTDGAVTFKKVPGYKGLGNYFTSGLATHPTDPNTAFMLFSQSGVPKIVKTTDMGQTWTDISGFEGNNGVSSKGFPNVAVYDLLIMPYNTDIYWACTEIGVFVSEDAGDSWKYMNNPAFPAVSIWEAGIVGDQVVLATHGRGIWTATIPELAGHSVANSTKVPVLKNSAAIPNALSIEMNLRSVYDSTVVKVNGKTAVKILGNTVGDTTVTVPVTTTGLVSVYVASYDGDKEYRTPASQTNAYVLKPAVDGYVNDFNDASGADDFTGHFSIKTANGFDNAAIHSEHNYSNSMDHIFMLLSPVKISAENAVLEYKDIAIVEPGDPNTNYGDSKFWDYVIVEGSKDGINWFALADGYDAGLHTEWKTAYDNKSAGDKSMFKTHSINLLDNNNISVGDQVFIRFRLYADNYTNGWGWAIDDLKIQAANIVGVDNATSIPETYELDQNYPNPFNPSTKIRFALPEASKVKLTIYNTLGQEVEVLVNEEMDAGYHTVDWNASRYASGAYFYTLSSKDFVKTKKLMFIK
ncbi:MAG: T9SS type A sorting domain-containing protein, partial [Rhodothermaceae bacterium]